MPGTVSLREPSIGKFLILCQEFPDKVSGNYSVVCRIIIVGTGRADHANDRTPEIGTYLLDEFLVKQVYFGKSIFDVCFFHLFLFLVNANMLNFFSLICTSISSMDVLSPFTPAPNSLVGLYRFVLVITSYNDCAVHT